MDTTLLISKLFELVKLNSRKAELITELSELRMRGDSADRGRDLNLHLRDQHRGHYDDSIYMEAWREYEQKKQELREELTEVRDKIATLTAEIESAVSETSTA